LDKLDYWKLCTEFTVVQAALIVCGIAPETLQWEVERMVDSKCPPGYVAIRTALVHALQSGKLNPSKKSFRYDEQGEETPYLDIQQTTLEVAEIDRFLKRAGMVCEFFDRTGSGDHGSEQGLNSLPVKLNAALRAWTAVSGDPARLRGKSPKQALEQWLIENAGDLALLNKNGEPNRTGIEEICKVANWKPEGGAKPTPSTQALPPPSRFIRLPATAPATPPPPEFFLSDLDDDIPF